MDYLLTLIPVVLFCLQVHHRQKGDGCYIVQQKLYKCLEKHLLHHCGNGAFPSVVSESGTGPYR